MNRCERCRWHLYLNDNHCLLNPWSELWCQQHDNVFFEERILEYDTVDEIVYEDDHQ